MKDRYIKLMEKALSAYTDEHIQRYFDDVRAGIHIPIIYGDYFFTEAILKLKGEEFIPW